jgi:prepilin peptidase CpaA
MNSWIFSIILFELIVVAWIDLKIKKISNSWIISNLLLSFCLRFLFSDFYFWSWESLVYPAGWLFIGFILFQLKIMGAGDSKYLASLYLLIPLDLHWPMLEKLLFSTMIVGASLILIKVIKDFVQVKAQLLTGHWKGLLITVKSNFSYAPVILVAWILLGVENWL